MGLNTQQLSINGVTLSSDVLGAINEANSPSAENPFVTKSDLGIVPKVYTANITEQESVQTSGALTVGVLYLIEQLQDGDDFSNVGYVTDGTPFEATGTTPTVWANSTQVWDVVASTPTAVVCDNTIGTITFTYISQGNYQINSDGLFLGKVWLHIDNFPYNLVTSLGLVNTDIINIKNYYPRNNANTNPNSTTSIEIRLYP